jgi:prepilin-type N-terminal cleavage/methylation domain-containing protein
MPASPAIDPPASGAGIASFALGERSRAASLHRRAFSMVELLIAMVVLSILVLLLTNLFNQVNIAWLTGEGGTERRRNARAVTDFMAAELRGAQVPVQGGGSVTRGNLQFIVNPADLPEEYRNADAAFWQAPIATETSYGDLAAIGYFVKWESSGARQRPMLCRFFVNPSRGSGAAVARNPEFLVYDPDPNAWRKTSILESTVQPANAAQGYKGLFAENVLGLWIECLDRNAKPIPANGSAKFDSRKGYLAGISSDGATWEEQRDLPVSVRVSLAQIDSRMANRLDVAGVVPAIKSLSKSSADAGTFLHALQVAAQGVPALAPLLPGVRTYSTEVQLRNAL